jgi:hypothetical protein
MREREKNYPPAIVSPQQYNTKTKTTLTKIKETFFQATPLQ